MIKYYGGKTWLPKYMKEYLPKDNNINTFVDLFVGGGSISDFLSTKYDKGICNDLDINLMNFYWVAYNRKNDLMKYILDNRDKLEFEQVKQFRYEIGEENNELIKAYKYYVCAYNGFSGKVYDTPTKSNLEAFKKRKIEKDFDLISKTLSKCELLSKDYHDIKYSNCLYYCDPPYFKVGQNKNRNNYYGLKGENHKEFSHYDFREYIEEISKNNKIIISYEDSETIREMYKDFNIISIKKKSTNYNTKLKVGQSQQTNELLIMNY